MLSTQILTYHLSKETYRLITEDITDKSSLFDRIISYGVKNQGLVEKMPYPQDLDASVPICVDDDNADGNDGNNLFECCPNKLTCITLSRMIMAYYYAKLS